jgi:hypothetical protein
MFPEAASEAQDTGTTLRIFWEEAIWRTRFDWV